MRSLLLSGWLFPRANIQSVIYSVFMEVTCWRCGLVFVPESSAGRCPNCGYDVRTPLARLRLAAASHFAMYKQAPWHILKLMVYGAVSFWVPDILWHVIRGSQFGGRDALGITVLLPISLLGTYILVKRLQRNEHENGILRWMLLGLWLLGGFFIMVGGSFLGAGFARSSDLSDFLQSLLISLIPGIVYIMATYDGSLGALFVVSIVPLFIWIFWLHGKSSKRS
jgi:hypothetical protein